MGKGRAGGGGLLNWFEGSKDKGIIYNSLKKTKVPTRGGERENSRSFWRRMVNKGLLSHKPAVKDFSWKKL